MAAFRFVVWFVILMCCQAAKFTFLPSFSRSHFLIFDRLGQTLETRGHEVQLVVGDTEAYASGHPNTLQYKTPQTYFDRMSTRHGPKKGLEVVSEMTESARLKAVYCDALLSTVDLMEKINSSDLIIGDGFYFCSSLIARKFSIPHVVIVTSTLSLPTMHAFSLPVPPSYIPQFKSALTDNMSFMQRVKNSCQWLLVYWTFWYRMVPPFQDLKEKHDIAPHETMYQTLGRVDLIISQRPFILEYPRPLLPNTKVVGPLLAATPISLSFDWEQFMQTSGDAGVILVSFGTILKNLTGEILTKMADAFSRIPQKIIWKLDKDSQGKVSFGNNTKVASWLPQNDILGHKKTKLFFNHGGVNGMMQAVYHGVPMVFAPFFEDQFDNAHTAKWFGIAEVVDLDLVTADELTEVLVTVMSTPSYRDSVSQMSKSITLLPRPPVQEAADWVEYTLAQGDLQHLRPKSLDLPFYKLYLLDVLLVVVIIVFTEYFILNVAFGAIKNVFLARSKEKKH